MQLKSSQKLVYVAMQNKYPFGAFQEHNNQNQKLLVRRHILVTQLTRKEVISKLKFLKQLSYQLNTFVKIMSILQQNNVIHIIYEYIPIHVQSWINNINQQFLNNIKKQVIQLCKFLICKNVQFLIKLLNIGMNQKYQLKVFIDYDFQYKSSIHHLKQWYSKNVQLLFKPYIKNINHNKTKSPIPQSVITPKNIQNNSQVLNLRNYTHQMQNKLTSQNKIQTYRSQHQNQLPMRTNQRFQQRQIMNNGNKIHLIQQDKVRKGFQPTNNGIMVVKQATRINQLQSQNFKKMLNNHQNGLFAFGINKLKNATPNYIYTTQYVLFDQIQSHFMKQAKDVLGISQDSSSISSFQQGFTPMHQSTKLQKKPKVIIGPNKNEQQNKTQKRQSNQSHSPMYKSINLGKGAVGNIKSSKKTQFQIQFSDGISPPVTKKIQQIKMSQYKALVNTNQAYFNDFMQILDDKPVLAIEHKRNSSLCQKQNQDPASPHLKKKQSFNPLNRGLSSVNLVQTKNQTKNTISRRDKSSQLQKYQNIRFQSLSKQSKFQNIKKQNEQARQIQQKVSNAIHTSMQVIKKLKSKK